MIRVIGDNLSKEDLCVQDIANELGLSRSKLYRKIKTVTGISANEIIRKTRLEKAKELLVITDMTIGEICYEETISTHIIYFLEFEGYVCVYALNK